MTEKYYDIVKESYKFSLLIIKLYKYLVSECSDYVLSKQILKSGTSIGANIRESQNGQSKKDFLSKMSIALKECHETQYWYDLLYDSNYLDNYADYNVINEKLKELLGVITKIVKTTKNNLP